MATKKAQLTQINFEKFLKKFQKVHKSFIIKLSIDQDRGSMPSGVFEHKHQLDLESIASLNFNERDLKIINSIGDALIDYLATGKNIMSFQGERYRTYVFQLFNKYLIIIKNQGKGEFFQNYEITIQKP